MPSVFQGIGTMNTALRAFQRALDVTGHNISNVNTPGYNRQTIDLTEADPTRFGTGVAFFLGNGVNADLVSRIRDQFLVARRVQAASEDGRLNSMNNRLNSVNAILQEPGGASIGDALDKFFNAWSALGSNPGDTGYLQQVQQAGSNLAARVRGLYSQLQDEKSQVKADISGAIQDAQTLINNVAKMNADIRARQSPGAVPNDLLDMRDKAIQDLGQIMPLTVVNQPDGSISLFTAGMTLVDVSGPATLPTNFDPATSTLSGPDGSFKVTSGSLGGSFQAYQKITSYQTQLDTFANSLRSEVNTIHMTGTNGLGQTGQRFFNDVMQGNQQTGAIDFDLDANVAADPQAIATGVSGNPGDGGLALSLSALRTNPISGLGGKTFGQFYAGVVSTIGGDVSYTQDQMETNTAIIRQVEQQIQSVSGVSLDDEMASMLRYQRSYQAAAKALSVFDQTTEDLINILH